MGLTIIIVISFFKSYYSKRVDILKNLGKYLLLWINNAE